MSGMFGKKIMPTNSPTQYGTFDECFDVVLEHEGGYGDDPGDPGGPTKYGVALNEDGPALTKLLGHAPTMDDIKNLTVAQAGEIFKQNYWDPMNISNIADYRDQMVIFDMCVLRGLSGCAKTAQAVVGVNQDGVMGPETVAAINKMDPLKFCENFLNACQAHFNASSETQFINGWTNRVNSLRDKVGLA